VDHHQIERLRLESLDAEAAVVRDDRDAAPAAQPDVESHADRFVVIDDKNVRHGEVPSPMRSRRTKGRIPSTAFNWTDATRTFIRLARTISNEI
jgi:hypothetical protein